MNTLFGSHCHFFGVFWQDKLWQGEEGNYKKSEAAWPADLANVTVFDNKAFNSCSKDIQIAVFKVVLLVLI